MGKGSASESIQDALSLYNFGLIVCIGIAGSLTSDLRLGDVCYSERILDVTENAKVDDIDSNMNIHLSPVYFDTPAELVAAINFSRVFPELQPAYVQWQTECKNFADSLLEGPVMERDGFEKILDVPKSKNGAIVCGLVTKSAHYNSRILGVERKALAIETESGGVFVEGKRLGIPCLTIRGISDHADQNKTKLEAATGEKVRRIAESNAARFFRLQLSHDGFIAALKKNRNLQQFPLDLETKFADNPFETITNAIAKIDEFIDGRLRELSPEFRLQAKGYRLPVPRIQQVQYAGGLGQNFSPDPLEIRNTLEVERVVLLSLSRNYPDYSLPWVIAADLVKAEISGKQALPVVVSGSRIRPPSGFLSTESEYQFPVPESIIGTQVIYIIDEFPPDSPTRMRFLEAQIKACPTAKFVIISRIETNIITAGDFSSAVGANFYNLTSVSFGEIAYFVQKNFDIGSIEAEVIALRLQETFQHFDLSAHPTYFAGISKEVLVSLLQANRRAELIQLAVDGFLTFVVSGDMAKVRLSRTTRARFLRTIVADVNLEKKIYTQIDLISMATDFATLQDFEIDPISFVSSFIDSGILHFQNGQARFALPFVESYLLAVELVEHSDKAKKYFDLNQSKFDVATFDIYAELGASPAVVQHVKDSINSSLLYMNIESHQDHILLSNIQPSSMRNLERLDNLQKSMQRTFNDIREGKGNIERKQRILNVADQVRNAAVDQSGYGRNSTQGETSEDELKADFAVRSWVVGTTLLGAGAEDLNGSLKQDIAQQLVELGTSIIHRWTLVNSKVDFEAIKLEMTSDQSMSEIMGDTSYDIADLRVRIAGVVDLFEFAFLAEPARRILGHLCDGARQKVLAVSVERARPAGLINEIFHGAWLSDIDGERGGALLTEVMRKLPNAPFLRMIIAIHLLTRVYWSHWRKEDRMRLLDLAAELMKPIFQIDKGKIRRNLVDSSDVKKLVKPSVGRNDLSKKKPLRKDKNRR